MAKKGVVKQAAEWTRRVHPKLRMMLNGDPHVNAYRAENTGACFMKTEKLADQTPPVSSVVTPEEARAVKRLPKLNRRNRQRAKVMVNVFVETTEAVNFPEARARHGNFAVIQVPLDRVETLVKRHPKVAFVEQAENLKEPGAIPLATRAAAPSKAVEEPKLHHNGKGVLIGIIDVQGFDWLHPDFDDGKGTTRFLKIWDQGRTNGKPPDTGKDSKKYNYGTEITQAMMKRAVAQAPKAGVSPHDLEPQSQMAPGSHGTHVTSIAAGNSGVCSKADIAAVLISLPEMDRRTSFYDATNLLDAISYLLDFAKSRDQPISINVSLGTNGHAHDGSSTLDRWIDALIAEPKRSVCVAAGNAGQERAAKPGDLGYILGRIHTSGRIASKGLNYDIEWIVAGDNQIDVSENELEFWYEPQDQIAVYVMPPGGAWIGPVKPGEFIENLVLPNKTVLSIYNERYHPANGSNYISIYLSPLTQVSQVIGITSGMWKVRLQGIDIRNGNFHGWIERDDPTNLGDGRYYWPSYFSEQSNVDASSVSSLACGSRIVSVANLDEAKQRIHITSSQGPTRDGRFKPDIAAVGTEVWAANGFGEADQPWLAMTGTSMASPYVAGVIGLMLAAKETLTAAQINGILKATARPLPGSTYEWVNDSGFGVIDPVACIKEALNVDTRSDLKEKFR
jgi:subtilisin family serine protease